MDLTTHFGRRLAHLAPPLAAKYPVEIEGNCATYMTEPLDDLAVAARLSFAEWEPYSRTVFWSLSRSSRRVLDVGAYTGVYSITAAIGNSDCHVLAVEPNPRIRPLLEANLLLNRMASQVTIIPQVLSSIEGTCSLVEGMRGYSSTTSVVPSEEQVGIRVTSTTLDELLGSCDIDLIKIDVEGHELEVLKGGTRTLRRSQPILLTEALDDRLLAEQLAFLARFGYLPPISMYRSGEASDRRNFLWMTPDKSMQVQSALDFADGSRGSSAFAHTCHE